MKEINLDASKVAQPIKPSVPLLNYRQAAGNTRLVGVQTAELIRFLISSSPGSAGSIDRFYIVGFSLGAQTAGYAGSYLRTRGMRLGRITGKG